MKSVKEIKQKRCAKLTMNRLKKNKEPQKVQDSKDVMQNTQPSQAPLAGRRAQLEENGAMVPMWGGNTLKSHCL
jgi:hypothetical protein